MKIMAFAEKPQVWRKIRSSEGFGNAVIDLKSTSLLTSVTGF
jgi:hypothetical protein